jgi:hypothetical protein
MIGALLTLALLILVIAGITDSRNKRRRDRMIGRKNYKVDL